MRDVARVQLVVDVDDLLVKHLKSDIIQFELIANVRRSRILYVDHRLELVDRVHEGIHGHGLVTVLRYHARLICTPSSSA